MFASLGIVLVLGLCWLTDTIARKRRRALSVAKRLLQRCEGLNSATGTDQ